MYSCTSSTHIRQDVLTLKYGAVFVIVFGISRGRCGTKKARFIAASWDVRTNSSPVQFGKTKAQFLTLKQLDDGNFISFYLTTKNFFREEL